MAEPMVTITAARLAELEAAEARLMETEERLAIQVQKNVERVRAYRAAHPEKANKGSTERVRRWLETNREEYNAKRREKYRSAKEAAAAAAVVTTTLNV
jgi:hypothetical protein